jgi:hypothetical protein
LLVEHMDDAVSRLTGKAGESDRLEANTAGQDRLG